MSPLKKTASSADVLERARAELKRRLAGTDLLEQGVEVSVGVLTPQEAIGDPKRRDFPILTGRERMVEAAFLSSKGHAFTDAPAVFSGPLRVALALSLDKSANRAVVIAVLNAVCRHQGIILQSLHCRDDGPESCGAHIAQWLFCRWGRVRVGMVGFNPAIADHLVDAFGKKFILITDRNPDNIGREKFGVMIWDSGRYEELISRSRVVLVTGTTLANGTFDELMRAVRQYQRDCWVYGVTASGPAHLLGFNNLCPFSR